MSEKRSSFCGVIPPLWWWLLTLLGLALLAYFMISTQQQPIEEDVASQVKQDLAAANIGWAEVETTNRGRDVLLQGVAPDADQRQEAVDIAQAAEGVRVVEDQVDTAKADIELVDESDAAALEGAQAPALSADGTANNDAAAVTAFQGVEMSVQPDGSLLLKGNVPQAEDIDVLVAAAEQRVGKEAVVNELSALGEGESPQWLAASEALVAAIPETEGRLKVGDGRVAVSGIIEEDLQRFDVMGKVDAALSDSNMMLTDNLQVADAEAAEAMETDAATMTADKASDALPEEAGNNTDGTTATSVETMEIADETEQASANSDSTEASEPTVADVADTASQTADAGDKAETAEMTDATDSADAADAASQTADAGDKAEAADATDSADAASQTTEADKTADTTDAATQGASGGINIVGLVTPEDEAANSCQDRFNRITDNDQILFASNKAELQSESLQVLNKVATVILECRDVLAERGVEIAGYTDSTGDAAYNQMLSQQRADAVKEYLLGSDVESGLLDTKGYGEADPVAPNNTAAGRAKNRRITFKIKQQ